MIGPNRASYAEYVNNFGNGAVDQAAWETAAASIGLREVGLSYADEVSVSPGLQLFMLASTLFQLGIYTPLGQPAANAEIWKESIIS